ncbi:hypothetical protein ACJVC5_14935 [Peredibacter sp. HCB2-198]|uniref:hypothetical protein n=1 Tax=Peredibacter sp. HCB2-198 TaxID=3383025 RepID=UPI0038B69496
MKSLLLALFAIIVSACSHQGSHRQPSSVKEFKVILSLKKMSDHDVVSRIDILATNTNPNSSSIDDEFRIEIDGQPVDVPERVYNQLSYSRRAYSYDYQSGGIEKKKPEFMCRMGGPAEGYILEARYLTEQGDSMRPVYSEGECHFSEIYFPKNPDSKIAAIKALAVLQTIKNMQPAR